MDDHGTASTVLTSVHQLTASDEGSASTAIYRSVRNRAAVSGREEVAIHPAVASTRNQNSKHISTTIESGEQ